MATYIEISEYSSFFTYYRYDVVTYNGEKWWAKRATTGNSPLEGANWTQAWIYVPPHTQEFTADYKKEKIYFGDGYCQTMSPPFHWDGSPRCSKDWTPPSQHQPPSLTLQTTESC